MKAKTIILPSKDYFIKLLASQFNVYAEIEINLIKTLIKFDLFTPFNLCKYTRERLRNEMNIPYSSLNTAISRLIKSGVIARTGKNCYVNPGFRGLENIDAIVFKIK